MTRTIVRGGYVLTMARTNYTSADVLIDGDTIAEVGPDVDALDAEVVDASDAIVMPGFVDAHRHMCDSLLRNSGSGGEARAGTCTAHYEPDDVYAATLVGLLGAVGAGITTVVDWFAAGSGRRHLEAALQAHADAGIRSVLVMAPPAGGGEEGPRWIPSLPAEAPPLMKLAAGSPDLRRDTLDSLVRDWAQARELGLRIHAHAATSPSDRGVIAAAAERGLLGPDVNLTHCSHLDDADLDALESTQTTVSLTPSSDTASGLGAPPIQELIDRGIRPGLGVDTERIAPGDMFAPMRATISLQHARHFDLKLAGKAGLPNLMTTRDVIRYATVDGASAAGLGGVTGVLEPGRQADLVVLRTDRPNIFPINDPIGAVVWGMDTSNLDWVFVAGKAHMRNGVLEADVERARNLATTAHKRVAAAAGSLTGAAPGGEQ